MESGTSNHEKIDAVSHNETGQNEIIVEETNYCLNFNLNDQGLSRKRESPPLSEPVLKKLRGDNSFDGNSTLIQNSYLESEIVQEHTKLNTNNSLELGDNFKIGDDSHLTAIKSLEQNLPEYSSNLNENDLDKTSQRKLEVRIEGRECPVGETCLNQLSQDDIHLEPGTVWGEEQKIIHKTGDSDIESIEDDAESPEDEEDLTRMRDLQCIAEAQRNPKIVLYDIEESDSETEAEREIQELQRDQKCEKIAAMYGGVWRRPIKEIIDFRSGPILEPPPIFPPTMVTYSLSGQRYVIDLNQHRPTTFKSQEALRLWDCSTIMNAERLVHQVLLGEFFPSSLDEKEENDFKQKMKKQSLHAKRVARSLKLDLSSDNITDIMKFIWCEEYVVEFDLFVKLNFETDPPSVCGKLEEFLEIPVPKLVFIKQPQVINTLRKLGKQVQWADIRQLANSMLENIRKIFKIKEMKVFLPFFFNQVDVFNKKISHLKSTYEKIFVTEEPCGSNAS